MPDPAASSTLTAYVVGDTTGWVLEPASPRRRWMDEMVSGFPYRCLPLSIANQCGWVIRSPVGFSAAWYGGNQTQDLVVRFDNEASRYERQINSHFGGGILTFSIPWLFRTPAGVALWVRGLPNAVRPGAQALDAVVETDWSPMTFTMNWQLTEEGRTVRWQKGDAVAFLMPISLDLVESMQPVMTPLASNPALHAAHKAWDASRAAFINRKDRSGEEWQRDYMAGRNPDGTPAPAHRSRLKIARFEGQG